MKLLKGHLTAGQKKAIHAILEAGVTAAKVGRQNYSIKSGDLNTLEIQIQRNDRGLGFIGEPLRSSLYTVVIERPKNVTK